MERGEFKKGAWIIETPSPIFTTLQIKVELVGYDEVKSKLKDLLVDVDILNSAFDRYIHPDQQRLDV